MKDRPPDTHKNNPSQLHDKITQGNTIHDSTQLASHYGVGNQIAMESSKQRLTFSNKNLTILNRENDSPPQETPTYEVSGQASKETVISVNSGRRLTGKIGGDTTMVPPQTHHIINRNTNDPFPKISSNFEPFNKFSQRPRNQATILPNPLPARSNVTETIHPAFPTIQQLKAKFNDHSNTNPQTNYKPTAFSEPSAPTVVPTFASKLRAEQPPVPTIELAPTKKTTKQGYPAVIFKRDDFMVKLAARCKYTVIGKFSSTMPKMELIRRSLTTQLQLKGSLKVTHFNSRHIYIDLDNEHDHATVWHREKIYVEGMAVRLFVWTPTFKPDQETPIAPVWIVLPQLPWHCYCMEMVSELLDPVGRALFLDAASFQKTRGSVAKVKIELDLTKPRPKYVWLGYDDDEFGEGQWQEIQYENVPDYCMYCNHKGHPEHSCTIKGRDAEIQKRKEEHAEAPTSSRVTQKDHIPPNTHRRNELTTHPNKHTADTKAAKQVYVPRNTVESKITAKATQLPVPASFDRNTGVNMKTQMLSEVPKNTNANLNCATVTTNNAFALLSTNQEQQVVVAAHSTIATRDNDQVLVGNSSPDMENGKKNGVVGDIPQNIPDQSEPLASALLPGTVAPQSNAKDATGGKGQLHAVGDVPVVFQNTQVICRKAENVQDGHANVPVMITDSAQVVEPCISYFAQPVEPCAYKNSSGSTKEWVLKSFYGSKQETEKDESLVVIEHHTGVVEQAEQDRKLLGLKEIDTVNFQQTSASKGTTTGRKKKKKPGKNSVNTEQLIPTARLEVMCKEASKVMKEVGRGFYPVPPQAKLVNEKLDAPTYFLGDLFADSHNDQTIPSKDGKSIWNLNAPLYIPNALRQQESQVTTDNVDSQKVPTLVFPNAPSDEVLLKNLDLHDIRGLLLRQNSPPQELPQKFSSAHPGIIEDGSEYEDEDDESTAYNYMEESRHGGLSPRLDQVRKPKLIKKKRRPLELKKKEEAPKEPKRVQPTRSSKSKSARANYAAKRL